MVDVFSLLGTVAINTKDAVNALNGVSNAGQSTLSKLTKSFGSKLGMVMKGAAVAAGGVAAAIGAIAIKGGIDRALAIENAQAKLKGLGHDTQSIEAIMDSALKSVKGTSYGLGDAAGIAASAVAAGIKPGEDSTRSLSLVADMATIMQRPLGDVGLIFNSVAGRGRILGDDLKQLQSAGISVGDGLVKAFGITRKEADKMLEDGKVDFAMFEQAMEASLGGAAKESGKTFQGAMSNVKAALGRLGEKIAVPALDKIKAWMDEAIPKIDELTAKAQPFIDQFWVAMGNAADRAAVIAPIVLNKIGAALIFVKNNASWLLPVILSVTGAFVAFSVAMQISLMIQKVVRGFQVLSTVLATVKNVLNGTATAQKALNLAMAANIIGIIVVAIAALVAGFIYLWNTNEGFRNFFINAWEGIKGAIGAVVSWFQNVVIPGFQAAWQAIVSAFQGAGKAISSAFQNAWNAIKSAVDAVVSWFQTYITPAFQVIGQILSAIFQAIWTAVVFVFNAIKLYFTTIFNIYYTIIRTVLILVVAVITTVLATIWNVIQTVFQAIKNFITPIWNAIYTAISNALSAIYATVSRVLSIVYAAISSALSAIWGVVSSVFNTVAGFIATIWGIISGAVRNAVNTIWGVVSSVFNTVRAFVIATFNNVKDTVVGIWNAIYSTISGIISNIVGTVIGAFSNLWNAIGNIFNGIKDTIGNVFGSVIEVVKRPINAIIGAINGFIGGINSIKVPDWVPGLGGQSANLPTLPQLAKGGIATGSTLAQIGEGKYQEAVIPLSSSVLGEIGKGAIQSAPLANSNNGELVTLLQEIKELLQNQKQQIVMDSGKLVGELHKGIDNALQKSSALRMRGLTV